MNAILCVAGSCQLPVSLQLVIENAGKMEIKLAGMDCVIGDLKAIKDGKSGLFYIWQDGLAQGKCATPCHLAAQGCEEISECIPYEVYYGKG